MFEEQDQYVQDRSQAMEQVETTIVELGDMFVQLAGMVKGIHLSFVCTINMCSMCYVY